ncbi:hypothetical protein EVAR_90799_1 [Eumeta japonica]|uniref:Uncharacterized protein n=1 Tax=Eumeta variegata TaxID=151549 RepID=A0A4C2A894_EUMVA|nr:hypothetical protein EVAR_90799_1 [Eumeta japonica]
MERWLKGVKRVATSSNDAECSKAVRAENTAITDPDDDATTSSSMVSKTKKRKFCQAFCFPKGFHHQKSLRTAALDKKLQWGSHIGKLAKRPSSTPYTVKKIRLSDVEIARLIYFGCFHSMVSCVLWGHVADTSTYCDSAVILKNKAFTRVLLQNSSSGFNLVMQPRSLHRTSGDSGKYPSSRQETSSTTRHSNGVRTVAEIEQRRLDLERRLEVDRLREENIAQNRQQRKILQDVVGTVLIERSSGGQHLAAFQAFEDSTDSRH